MANSAGKRQREQHKAEKMHAKAERKASRQASQAELDAAPPARSESELIVELAALHGAFDNRELSPEDFERRREDLQAQLERYS